MEEFHWKKHIFVVSHEPRVKKPGYRREKGNKYAKRLDEVAEKNPLIQILMKFWQHASEWNGIWLHLKIS